MTNYYARFDSNGNQEETRLGADPDNGAGWIDTGLTDISSKMLKLVDGQVVVLSPEQVSARFAELAYQVGLNKAKDQRGTLLYASDWTQNSDNSLSESEKQAWATYRQALRDLPDSVNADGSFTLPVAPNPSFNTTILG